MNWLTCSGILAAGICCGIWIMLWVARSARGKAVKDRAEYERRIVLMDELGKQLIAAALQAQAMRDSNPALAEKWSQRCEELKRELEAV